MIACKSTSQVRRISRKPSRGPCRVEALERRTLLSASWSTIDSDPSSGRNRGMAADHAGNVYAAGSAANGYALIKEKANGSSNWAPVYQTTDPNIELFAIATDAGGDAFAAGRGEVAGSSGYVWLVLERPAGQSSFSRIDGSMPTTGNGVSALATDAAGDVYSAGQMNVTTTTTINNKTTYTTTEYGVVRKLVPGPGGFTATNVLQTANTYFNGVTVIASGAFAGVYAAGRSASNWVTIKSGDGGATWSQVDTFRYDSSSSSNANAVVGDLAGNVYVGGNGQKATTTITGYTKNHQPIYSTTTSVHWIVRKSSDGGASWSVNDDYQLSLSDPNPAAVPSAVGTDLAGNVYVAGTANGSADVAHAIVRTNAGGSWSTADDYPNASASAFAVDSSGNLYAGGRNLYGAGSWIVRSLPAAPTNLMVSSDAIMPSSQIDLSWANAAASDETGFAIYRSTDGINFTAVATVGPNATAYSDSGLTAGTTYYYYVVALLNATGQSNNSNTASATTSS